MIVWNEREPEDLSPLQAKQQGPSLRNRKSILWRLRQHPHKPKFGNRAGCQFRLLRGEIMQPECDSLMKFVLKETERYQGVYIQEIAHGKLERISSTSLLARSGEFAPTLRTGRPVIGSRTIFAFRKLGRRGVNTTRPPSIFASSLSPARRPSFRRIGIGSTICPLVEILVRMVRRSYLNLNEESCAVVDGDCTEMACAALIEMV